MIEFFINSNYIKYENFLWIITKETLCELLDDKWYKSEEILEKYIDRMVIVGSKPELDIHLYMSLCHKYIQLYPGINIHSTQIRDLIKEGKNPKIYMNEGVMNIIKENKLYI